MEIFSGNRLNLCGIKTIHWHQITRHISGSMLINFITSISFSRLICWYFFQFLDLISTVDNKGGRRDWKRACVQEYGWSASQSRDYQSLRIAQNMLHQQMLSLMSSRETWCALAESPKPETKRRKNLAAFLNRYVGGLPISHVEFSWEMYAVEAFP